MLTNKKSEVGSARIVFIIADNRCKTPVSAESGTEVAHAGVQHWQEWTGLEVGEVCHLQGWHVPAVSELCLYLEDTHYLKLVRCVTCRIDIT